MSWLWKKFQAMSMSSFDLIWRRFYFVVKLIYIKEIQIACFVVDIFPFLHIWTPRIRVLLDESDFIVGLLLSMMINWSLQIHPFLEWVLYLGLQQPTCVKVVDDLNRSATTAGFHNCINSIHIYPNPYTFCTLQYNLIDCN